MGVWAAESTEVGCRAESQGGPGCHTSLPHRPPTPPPHASPHAALPRLPPRRPPTPPPTPPPHAAGCAAAHVVSQVGVEATKQREERRRQQPFEHHVTVELQRAPARGRVQVPLTITPNP